MTDYWNDERWKPIAEWLLSMGFVRSHDGYYLEIAWGTRIGYDHTSLLFYPHNKGVEAVIGHHASGTNPKLGIGTCETLEDVQRTYEAIRLINGFKAPEEHRRRESVGA